VGSERNNQGGSIESAAVEMSYENVTSSNNNYNNYNNSNSNSNFNSNDNSNPNSNSNFDSNDNSNDDINILPTNINDITKLKSTIDNSESNNYFNIFNNYIKNFSKQLYEITNEIYMNRPLNEIFQKNNRMLFLGIFLIIFSILLIPIL
jgi:hypothetical protein